MLKQGITDGSYKVLQLQPRQPFHWACNRLRNVRMDRDSSQREARVFSGEYSTERRPAAEYSDTFVLHAERKSVRIVFFFFLNPTIYQLEPRGGEGARGWEGSC